MTDRDRCMARLAALYPALTEEQADRFGRYYTLLVEWNRTRNLTAITEPEAVAEKHFFDSLAAAPLLPAAARCIDVGTGAGFPGIPLLIVRPDLAMTLLDALQKRIDFLQAALEALGLAAQCLHLRAEDAGRDPALRASFDAAPPAPSRRCPSCRKTPPSGNSAAKRFCAFRRAGWRAAWRTRTRSAR